MAHKRSEQSRPSLHLTPPIKDKPYQSNITATSKRHQSDIKATSKRHQSDIKTRKGHQSDIKAIWKRNQGTQFSIFKGDTRNTLGETSSRAGGTGSPALHYTISYSKLWGLSSTLDWGKTKSIVSISEGGINHFSFFNGGLTPDEHKVANTVPVLLK